MSPDRPPSKTPADHGPGRPTAAIVALLQPAARRFRRDAGPDGPRGEILLFTGIRYERVSEPDAPSARLRRRS